MSWMSLFISFVAVALAVITVVLIVVFAMTGDRDSGTGAEDTDLHKDYPQTLADESDPAQRHQGDVTDEAMDMSDADAGSGEGVPINIATRGETEFAKIGNMTTDHETQVSAQRNVVLPLYGKPTFPKSPKWLYYTIIEDEMVYLEIEDKDCSDEDTGCDELFSDDIIVIDQLGSAEYTIQIYPRDDPKYIPV
ncbi:hypothetical protein TetV_411 [Tetraselmis virus 1]|uniref:Uncharacterized protein n=1 Tax=Tetraselmis virus 1 TaxID=2060617 RepID=A0A2P0VNK6_9VIRU|nr:hypothetical protein QJ968_gp643 [Tetraselmis virus 1]AUF82493.1 hypothetical protein TetV_411 [Tetraselmis virus 1]